MEQHQIESSVLPDRSEQTNRGRCERYSPHKIDDRSGMVSFITSFKIYIYIYIKHNQLDTKKFRTLANLIF